MSAIGKRGLEGVTQEENCCSSFCNTIMDSLFSLPSLQQTEKKLKFTSDPLIEIGARNNAGDNERFFQLLFEALTKDPKFQIDEHLSQLVKVHNSNSGISTKIGIHTFLTRVFSSNYPLDEGGAKYLVLHLYLYSDMISEETFNILKEKIAAKSESYPITAAFLGKLHYTDSPHKRLLISLFEDPDQTQFDLDFHRSDFVNKERFMPLVRSLFPNIRMRNQFLNFFHQGSKAYSLYKILQHPQLGLYIIKEGSFFLRREKQRIIFGYHQTAKDALSQQTLTHYLEFTFKTKGATLIDRLVSSKEKMVVNGN